MQEPVSGFLIKSSPVLNKDRKRKEMKASKRLAKAFALALIFICVCSIGVEAECQKKDSILPEFIQQHATVRNSRVFFDGGSSRANPEQDSVYRLINKFYLDQFRHSQDPKIPYFIFMSKDANVAMGIGGVVRMLTWFDWNGSMPSNGFSVYNIGIPRNPADMRRLGFTPGGTSIFYTILGRNKLLGEYMGYIQGDFKGYNNVGFRLKKAYFTFHDWTVGYATSTFCDPSAQPPVLDSQGPNAEMSKTNVLVRWLKSTRYGLVYGGSVELASSKPDVSEDSKTEKCSTYLPDVAAMLQYQWNSGKSHVRLSGLLKGIPYRDLVEMKNHTIVGWGVQASAVAKIARPLTMYGIVSYGCGHESYSGDLSIGNYDLVAVPGKPGELYAPAMLGLTWGSTYYFRPNLYATVALGELRYLPRENPRDSEYKYGLYGGVNCQWEITPRVVCGLEYLIGKRMNFDATHGSVNRINAMVQVSF